jgi:DNA-binding response OmpR family regulator
MEEKIQIKQKPVKRILICTDDADDQFIFGTALKEVAADIQVQFFYTSQAMMHHLLEISIGGKEEQFPDMIIGDMKVPFFELKDISEIRTFRQFRKIPVYVFAESFSDITKSTALKIGATEFFHKPDSLHKLKAIIENILKMERHDEIPKDADHDSELTAVSS